MSAQLWSLEAMVSAMGARRAGTLPGAVPGLSIDTRTLKPGEAFFAITGESRDGHDFVAAAIERGAGLAVVTESKAAGLPAGLPLLIVPDVLAGLVDLARASRARSAARIVAVTGSVGKTGTKEALRLALSPSGETHASAASYNNHWGVPLSLALMPASAQFAVFEIGMNHAGEITPLVRLVRPHVAIITTIEPVHFEYFGSIEAIADAKAEILLGIEPGGAAVLNRDNAQFERLARAAAVTAPGRRVVSFGEAPDAGVRLVKASLGADSSAVEASIAGRPLAYAVGAPGRHLVANSLAVLAAAELLGADVRAAAKALAGLKAPVGRGARLTLTVPGGTALLIDESYNANPASMRAALANLGRAAVTGSGRRIAVLGDMLELGPQGAAMHAGLREPILAASVDRVFCSGPLMRSLWEALPPERRGGYAETAAALQAQVVAAVGAGDAVMVKGSLGSRMGPIVTALMQRSAPPAALAQG